MNNKLQLIKVIGVWSLVISTILTEKGTDGKKAPEPDTFPATFSCRSGKRVYETLSAECCKKTQLKCQKVDLEGVEETGCLCRTNNEKTKLSECCTSKGLKIYKVKYASIDCPA